MLSGTGFSVNICCLKVSKCGLAYSAMSVRRLYLNLSSSVTTWNRLPNDSSLLLVCKDSKEEDGNDEQDEEDERLRCLRFFLRDLCLLGEGEHFSVEEDEEVLL